MKRNQRLKSDGLSVDEKKEPWYYHRNVLRELECGTLSGLGIDFQQKKT